MTINARRIASVPVRTASDTWRVICDLLTPSNEDARAFLHRANGLASMLIADECTREDAIIVSGGGPQIRVYTLHGEDALEDADEAAVAFDPDDAWSVSLPCGAEDLAEAQSIAKTLSHIEVRETGAALKADPAGPAAARPVIDLDELERA